LGLCLAYVALNRDRPKDKPDGQAPSDET